MGIFGNAFGWPHLLLILAVILLLFGAAKLPALAKSIGQSTRIFRGEMKAMKAEDGAGKDATTSAPAAETAPEPVRNETSTAAGGKPDAQQ